MRGALKQSISLGNFFSLLSFSSTFLGDHETSLGWQNLSLRGSKVNTFCIYGHVASGSDRIDTEGAHWDDVDASLANVTTLAGGHEPLDHFQSTHGAAHKHQM